MNTALLLYGIGIIWAPASTIRTTWIAGTIACRMIKYTVSGVLNFIKPAPPPIEDGWNDIAVPFTSSG